MDWIERLPPRTKWFFIVGGGLMSFFSGALPESVQTAGLLCGLLLLALGLWQARREALGALGDACAQFPWRIRIEHRDHPPPLGATQVATATVSNAPQRKYGHWRGSPAGSRGHLLRSDHHTPEQAREWLEQKHLDYALVRYFGERVQKAPLTWHRF